MTTTLKYGYEEAVTAMTNAHNTGDYESANKIANYIKQNNLQPVEVETQPTPEAVESSSNYYIDKAKSGAANFVFNILNENDQLSDYMLGLDPFSPEYQLEGGRFDNERYRRDKQIAIENAKEEFFGYKGVKPTSELERYLGTGVEGVVSEGPLAFLGAKKASGAITEVLHSYAANILGQFGAETAATVTAELGGGETAQQVAATAGGLVLGGATIPGRVAGTAAIETGKKAFSERKRVNQSVDTAAEYVASSEVKQLIDNATKIQPDLDDVLKATVDLQSEIPGLIVPPVAALADNPIYTKNTEYLLRTNPEFYAKAKESLSNAKTAIDARKEALFGTAGPQADAKLKAALPANYDTDIRVAKKRINAINTQLEKVTNSVRTSVDYIDVGKRTDNLMKAKEAGVRAKLGPKYDKVLKDADTAGVVFPASSVAKVHQMYKGLRSEDLFASFPSLTGKLNKQWSPKKVEPSPIIIPGVTPPKMKKEYKSVPLTEMDSLKRELNKAIRKVKDPTQKRVLTNLKASLNGEITKLPEEFSEAYKAIDLEFYRELGIPKNKAEIDQLDSAKFMSQTGSYLSKPEQAQEFLGFVGDAGIPVVRDAILVKMQGAGLVGGGVYNTDGLLDPRKLAGFVSQNRALINTVPGLQDEFLDTTKLVNNLTSVRGRLESEYNVKAKELGEGFYKAFHNKGISTVTSEILGSAAGSQKYLKDIKNFDPETAKMAKQAVRAGLIEKAMGSPNTSTIDFIKENQRAFAEWFGPTYAKDVDAIAQASDLINKIDIDTMKFALDYKNQDILFEKAGISGPQLQSVLRDRISNGLTKLAIIGSKISTSSVSAKRDSKVMELLLNPESLKTIRAAVQQEKIKVLDPKTFAKIGQAVNNSVYRGLYFGGVAAGPALEEVQTEEQ